MLTVFRDKKLDVSEAMLSRSDGSHDDNDLSRPRSNRPRKRRRPGTDLHSSPNGY
jgi:hypothetical protein